MSLTAKVLKNVVSKPFTRRYPREKVLPYEHFRGILKFYPEKCIGCRQCERNCPSKAIKFYKKGRLDFDMGKCIYCGLCEDICPGNAIKLTNEFEKSVKDKKKLIVK